MPTAIQQATLSSLSKNAAERVKKMVVFRAPLGLTDTVDTFLGLPEFSVTTVPSIGEGDADVFTQEGRSTTVTVRTQGLSVSADSRSIQFQLLYRIEENSPDYTTLESRSQIVLPAPAGYVIAGIGSGLSPADWHRVFPGKDHNWHDVSDQVQGTYLSWLSVKFDGKGRDDRGNAQLMASINVPVTLRAG